MSKVARSGQQSARERITAQRGAARRAGARRRLLVAGGSVLAVIGITVAFVVIKVNSGTSRPPAGSPVVAALPRV